MLQAQLDAEQAAAASAGAAAAAIADWNVHNFIGDDALNDQRKICSTI